VIVNQKKSHQPTRDERMNNTAICMAILATSSPATPPFSHERSGRKTGTTAAMQTTESHPQKIA